MVLLEFRHRRLVFCGGPRADFQAPLASHSVNVRCSPPSGLCSADSTSLNAKPNTTCCHEPNTHTRCRALGKRWLIIAAVNKGLLILVSLEPAQVRLRREACRLRVHQTKTTSLSQQGSSRRPGAPRARPRGPPKLRQRAERFFRGAYAAPRQCCPLSPQRLAFGAVC